MCLSTLEDGKNANFVLSDSERESKEYVLDEAGLMIDTKAGDSDGVFEDESVFVC